MRRLEQVETRRRTAEQRRRPIFRRVFVAMLLLLLIDTAAWAIACYRLQRGIDDAAGLARQQGWSLAAAQLRWGGWPLAAEIDFGDVAEASEFLPGLVWQAERTGIRLALLHPRTLAIQIGGAQSVEARGVAPIPFTADRFLIDADLAGAAPPQVSIAALKANLPTGQVGLANAQLVLPPDGIVADLHGLALPGVATAIGALHLRASIDPALPAAATPEASARAWREAGGHVEISEATLQWDKLGASGSGRITLDQQLQPQAEGTIDANGLPLLLDDLVRTGAIAAAQATAAKAVLAVLAASSGGQHVQLPVSLDDGVLRLARFPLLRTPPLAWD